jgi:hypothetical protein
MNLLKTKVGLFFYLILQNRFIWSVISKFEQERIKKNNFYFNNYRSDYNPKDYQNSKSWDRFDKQDDYRKWLKFLLKIFKKYFSGELYLKKKKKNQMINN